MAGETFQLKFRNNEDVLVSIDEPINFATVDFQLSQKEKGYGRDISFNGGEVQFEFVKYRNHYLDKLIQYNNTYGFESIVDLIITCGNITTIIGELDFATAVTDDLEYFKCKVIQQSSKQIVKRRKAVKVDLLSDKDIDGNTIAPLVPENTFLLSKPIYEVSKWEQTQAPNKGMWAFYNQYAGNPAVHVIRYINHCVYLTLHGLENAYVPNNVATSDINKVNILKAATDLSNIVITIPASYYKAKIKTIGYDLDVAYTFTVQYGSDSTGWTTYNFKTKNFTFRDEEFEYNEDFTYSIPSLLNGQIIRIFHKYDFSYIYDSTNSYYGYVELTTGLQTIEIEAETSTFNSVAPSFRLIDVMRQVVKSVSGLDIYAPRFNVGGDFYDNRLFNGNSLRAISNKPFYVSLEDLEKSLVELNVDWEIDANGNIFFGTEDDFYQDTEIYEFTNTQFSSFNKSFNPRFSVNEFNYGYKNFQSLKENEEPNSADVIHGESKWVLGNKMVENKKDVSIEWIRDSFLIETNRRKALSEKVTDETASQDDDKIFAIDTYSTPSDVVITQKCYLQHIYDSTNLLLSLVIQAEDALNFLMTGINEGTVFEITSGVNVNVYRVYDVVSSTIRLEKLSGSVTPASYSARDTFFKYTLIKSEIPYTNYTDSGFTNIDNLIGGSNYSNLRYSVRRNIDKYWKKYLATCNLYHKTQGLSNTWYKNNTDFSSTYSGLTLTEREVIDTYAVNPNLTPFMYNDVIFSNVEFSDFITLQDNLRTDRGYIKTKDNNGNELKLHPTVIKYDNLSKELNIKAEERYTPTTLVQIAPVLTTKVASDITGVSATSGGYIKTNGGSAITSKGIVWNTSTNPTIALTTKTNDGTGSVDYKSNITGLIPSKKYYVKSYAVNSRGTSYGNEVEFISDYNKVIIGSQTWADSNLNVSTYSDGTIIEQVTNSADWADRTTGAWCYYYNNPFAEDFYGKLYNWYAIAGIHNLASLNDTSLRKKIAPNGWHIPSQSEFQTLANYLGGNSVAGGKMKTERINPDPDLFTGYGMWRLPNAGATNSSNFNGYAGGKRDGTFIDESYSGFFWTSTPVNLTTSYYGRLYHSVDDFLILNDGDNKRGYSARLIKD
jgi:uncharacterized protein (TIGR02145 family)